MRTLLLDTQRWDLCIDNDGNIAVASEPYALAQDAASACRLVLGECWYDTTRGIPFFDRILGHPPSLPYIKGVMAEAAAGVPGVVAAACFISSVEGRVVTGQVQITDDAGTVLAANF